MVIRQVVAVRTEAFAVVVSVSVLASPSALLGSLSAACAVVGVVVDVPRVDGGIVLVRAT